MNIPESPTGQGFGSRSFNKNHADSPNSNPNTKIRHCQSLNGREDDSRSVTIAAIALDVNNEGGRGNV